MCINEYNLVQKIVVRQPVGVKEVMAAQQALVSWEGRGLERGQITLHLLGGVGRAVGGILSKEEGATNKCRMRVSCVLIGYGQRASLCRW